ncbi:hypothetical protein Pd630_LPD01584 [Rhodococcus opacus PD630]|nr:hypothetical protein Pd630_LPD01584 [Rhodococcus opacus PD630]
MLPLRGARRGRRGLGASMLTGLLIVVASIYLLIRISAL